MVDRDVGEWWVDELGEGDGGGVEVGGFVAEGDGVVGVCGVAWLDVISQLRWVLCRRE